MGSLTDNRETLVPNDVIRAVTTWCQNEYGYEVHGIRRGWKGLLSPEDDTLLFHTASGLRSIIEEGGTILLSSRANLYKNEGDAEKDGVRQRPSGRRRRGSGGGTQGAYHPHRHPPHRPGPSSAGRHADRHDRILSTRSGLCAVEVVKNGEWDKMVALHGNDIATVSLSEATDGTKTVPADLCHTLKTFFE